jgi:hypothetical protein
MNYYNYLANYANPLLSQGNLLGQHSLDVNYRVTDIRFKLFPSSVIRPYVDYVRSSAAGPGYTTYSVTGNEFLLGTNWANVSNEILGGVEVVLPTLTFTFEQGWRFLKNDTSVGGVIDTTGNVDSPYLGQTITMDSLNRGYHDRTTLPTSKFALKYSPFQSLRITGRYIYSAIDLDSAMNEVRTGNLISLENQLLYSAAADAFTGKASKPDHHGAFALEYTPFSRLTVIDRFENQSSHLSGSAILASTYFGARALSGQPGTRDQQITDLVNSFLEFNKIRNEASAEIDMGGGFSLRGGERFSYTQAKLIDSENSGRPDQREAKAIQNTGIGGVSFRPGNWLRLSLDYEITRSNAAVLRTDLLNYDQLRFTWRVSPIKSVTLGGRVGLLKNSNRQTDIDLKSHNRDYSFEASYEPSSRFSLNLDYTHTSILSDMAILIPQTLDPGRSIYDERGSSAGGSLGIDFFKGVRGDVGLRAVLNAGDLPFNYYQPFATITIPIMHTGMAFKTYWQDFGYNEKNSDLLDHRSHLFTFSLAYSR